MLFHVDVIQVIQVRCTLGNVSGVLFKVVAVGEGCCREFSARGERDGRCC